MWQIIKDFIIMILKVLFVIVGGWLFMTDIFIPLYLCDLHPEQCEEIIESRWED